KCSTKIFLEQIPYFKRFQCELIEKVLEISISKNCSEINEIIDYLVEFRKRDIYDVEFYGICVDIVFKGINVLISDVEDEILDFKFERLRCLYEYSYFNIDIKALFVNKLIDIS